MDNVYIESVVAALDKQGIKAQAAEPKMYFVMCGEQVVILDFRNETAMKVVSPIPQGVCSESREAPWLYNTCQTASSYLFQHGLPGALLIITNSSDMNMKLMFSATTPYLDAEAVAVWIQAAIAGIAVLAPKVTAFLLKCADGSAVIEDALIEV